MPSGVGPAWVEVFNSPPPILYLGFRASQVYNI